MKTLVQKVFGLASRLTDLERAILHAVRDRLPPREAAQWENQIKAINKVQRLPGDVEVNFYRMKRGQPSFDEDISLKNKDEELLVAEVEISAPTVSEKLHASVWAVRGFLFSIEYKGSVAYFTEAAAMDPPSPLCLKCQIGADVFDNA